jgi:hypothetical protein
VGNQGVGLPSFLNVTLDFFFIHVCTKSDLNKYSGNRSIMLLQINESRLRIHFSLFTEALLTRVILICLNQNRTTHF